MHEFFNDACSKVFLALVGYAMLAGWLLKKPAVRGFLGEMLKRRFLR